MDDLKMQKQTLKKAYKKTKRKHITPWKILAIICAVVMIVSIPLSILLQKFDNTMAARFGGSFWKLQNEDANAQYYTSDFNSAEEMVNYGLALTQQVEAEGAALLMNNNNALPLAADAKVSTFSSSSVNLVYGGTGSGNIDASTADTLRPGTGTLLRTPNNILGIEYCKAILAQHTPLTPFALPRLGAAHGGGAGEHAGTPMASMSGDASNRPRIFAGKS